MIHLNEASLPVNFAARVASTTTKGSDGPALSSPRTDGHHLRIDTEKSGIHTIRRREPHLVSDALQLPLADIRDGQVPNRVLLVELPELELIDFDEAKRDQRLVVQYEGAIRANVGAGLEHPHVDAKRRPQSPFDRGRAIQGEANHLRVVEGWPAAEYGSELFGTAQVNGHKRSTRHTVFLTA